MTPEIYRLLSFVGMGIMVVATIVLVEAVLRGLVARFSGPAGHYDHRVGTQLPRILE
jgi:hypothetical protein